MTTDSERPRLRELRTELGWTQQELAERLAHLAWMKGDKHAGGNADMVAKWERGVKGISPRYRELLCHLFGVTPDQLGLKNTPPATTERTQSLGDDQSLLAMLDNAAGLLDQLGAAGTALAPHMLHAWKDAVTTRRTMLGLLDPSATDPVGHARAATATVADLEQLAVRYHALYETADPKALLTSVAAHVRMAQDALRQYSAADARRRLLRNLVEVAILAGRLAADDHALLRAGDHNGARETLTAALDQLRPTARRKRVLVLIDLATAELHSSNLPAACSCATQAADLLQHTSYTTGAARLRAFRDAAARPIDPRALRVLDEYLALFSFQCSPKHRPGTHPLDRALFRGGLVPVLGATDAPRNRSEQSRAARLLREALPQAGRIGDAWTPPGEVRARRRSGLRSCTEEPLMTGRHRLRDRRVQRTARHRAIEVVDARTLTAHFLTMDALATGRLPTGRYTALCGQDVLPASLTEAGRGRCPSCVSIPRQRSRAS